jgi:ATP-dependent exoDNAse (exonuclease V) beta subunit
MVEYILDKLKYYDDPDFKFDPIKHRYTYKGETLISVTQFISRFHEKFDSDFWAKKKADERGVEPEVILKEWSELNERANFVGHSTHTWIENYFNRIYQELPNDVDIIDRINKFNKLYATDLHKMTPVCFEKRIFSPKWKIGGMIDALFLYGNSLYIMDYKTNKEFTTNSKFGGKLLPPFQDYDKCHLSEYSIQQSLYSFSKSLEGYVW